MLQFSKSEIIKFISAKIIDENRWLKGYIKGKDGTWRLMLIEYLELKNIE